uniref:Uncharacterized protein n=1 Tax=Tanacetum cinerariifolium TaxID=118510 RepID=A0A699H821_TANCI|nr:hypothetical protein [Tanacetum cinerariifolium]
MSDTTACLNDISYIPPNNEQNEPTLGDIGETSNEPTQAKRNEFEELYASANEELYPGCDYVTRLDFMHATGKFTEPGKMQHPVDGRAWKNFNTRYPDFTTEQRNVRLGLVADGFNPFGNLCQSYNMWPFILTTYNLHPWLCMKENYLVLTLLITGPKSSDHHGFPARSSLCGWSGQGYIACPACNEDTLSMHVLSKTTYIGHRRFLKKPHKWRRSLDFKGETKDGDPPRKFTRA